MKTRIASLAFLLLSGVLSATAESLIVTNGETLEMGGLKSYETVLISNGTIYLTNDTIITSASDIQILSGATITWHYTTTNWSTNIYLDSHGLGGSGASVLAKNGSNAWNITLQAASNLTVAGTIDLRGGAGQTHMGNAAQGSFGGDFRYPATRETHIGGTGGSSCGGNGGQGATLFLTSSSGNMDIRNANLNLSGGDGGNSGDGGTGGEGGSTPSGQGANGGSGGISQGGNGGNGGQLIIRTQTLYTNSWICLMEGGTNGLTGNGGAGGLPGTGSWGSSSAGEITIFASGGSWNGNQGPSGQSYDGLSGISGTVDVIKKAEARPQFENGQISLGLDMTSTSATYIVECCTNLFTADWQAVGTFYGQGGATNWTSIPSNGSDKAFYRIQTTY